MKVKEITKVQSSEVEELKEIVKDLKSSISQVKESNFEAYESAFCSSMQKGAVIQKLD